MSKINYVEHLNKFYEYIQTTKITAKAQALYFIIFEEFNKNYFVNMLQIKLTYLTSVLHLSKKDINKHRQELAENKLIKFTMSTDNRKCYYTLLELPTPIEPINTLDQPLLNPRPTPIEPVPTPIEPKTPIYNNINNNIYIQTINERKRLYISLIEQFKKALPNKIIDCEVIPDNINMDKLIQSIKESDFLLNNANLNLKFFINNYEKITNNYYKNYNNQKENKQEFIKHTFTSEELNNLFDNLDEVKIV